MNENERRRYFRVTDLVGLTCRFLTEGERDLAVESKPSSLKSLLGQIEDKINSNLARIQNTQPEVHQVLDLLNQKINLAFGHGILTNEELSGEDATKACQVNLSACGIAFPSSEPAALNQYIAIELILYPTNSRLELLLAVISCDDFDDDDNQNSYLVRANFVNISDVDQEVLVQHVLKRQVSQLKESRAESISE